MSQGEQSSGTGNRRAALIVDSQLQGVARLIGSTGILSEGAYAGIFTAGNLSVVNLTATAQNFAFEAYVDGEYVAQNTTLQWPGLPDNSVIYLYGQTQENNLYQSSEFSSLAYKQVAPIFTTNGLTPPNAILVAIVTTTGSSISINTGPSISDSSFAQRPMLFPYGQHRTAIPIDHPFHSIFNSHLTDNIIRSNNLYPWDGQTSGTGMYSLLSGTGIASCHIKPQSVDSRALAPSLSCSGLAIQASFTTLHGAVSVLSGTTISPGYLGQNILELVPLQVLQTSLSGTKSFLQQEINVLGSNQSGISNTINELQNLDVDVLVSNFSGLDSRSQADEINIATLGFNQSGIQNTISVLQSGGTATLGSNFSGLDTRTQVSQRSITTLSSNYSGLQIQENSTQGRVTVLTSNFSGLQNNVNNAAAGSPSIVTTGTLTAGALGAGFTTVAVAQGGTGGTTSGAGATGLGLGTGNSPTFTGLTLSGSVLIVPLPTSDPSTTGALFSSAGYVVTSGSGIVGNQPSYYTMQVYAQINLNAVGGIFYLNGPQIWSTAGYGLQLKSGTSQMAGNATLVAGTKAVANAAVTSNTQVILTPKTAGGTIGTLSYTTTPGTGFTINSSSIIDTSTVTYFLFELN
jgi:hypothetical protein